MNQKSLTNEILNSNLKSLSNETLNSNLKSLVHQERELLSSILHHIAEVDRRKLYLKISYPNLFEYLTQHLGYSNGSAQRRLEAARLLNEVPTLTEKLESGDLNLSQVAFMQKCIRQKKRESQTSISKEQKQNLIEELMGKSQEDSQRIVSQVLDLEVKQAPKVCQQKDESVRLEVTLSKTQWEKLNRMRELLSTSLPIGSWGEVLEYVSDKVIAQKTKIKAKTSTSQATPETKTTTAFQELKGSKDFISQSFKNIKDLNSEPLKDPSTQSSNDSGSWSENSNLVQNTNPIQNAKSIQTSNSLTSPFQPPRSAAVSAAIKKFILNRDLCCQHVDPKSKKKCASKWNLQVDHIQPVWAGGNNEVENLRVLCASHNRQRYKEQAGIRLKA